jgi:signal transduction histidine kinase
MARKLAPARAAVQSQTRVGDFTYLRPGTARPKMLDPMLPAARYLRDTAVFAPCYIALDWASYIDPLGPFNITPWNPQPALAVAWMLLGGLHHFPVVLATVFGADLLIRHAPAGYAITALTSLVLAAGYLSIAAALRTFLGGGALRSTRDLTLFAAVVVAGTAAIGAAFVGVLRTAHLLAEIPAPSAWLRFWIGDAVGILVTAPLLLAVANSERRADLLRLARRAESLAQVAALAATLWLVFGALGGDPSRHFYLLFVPLIWIAARGGMNSAVVATAIVQMGVVIAIHREGAPSMPIVELQALVAVLTLTGLYLGMMVDERSRATEDLRQSLRLAAAGEMAGAIAHEVNQPLTALSNYGQAALALLARGGDGLDQVPGVVGKMLGEAERAADVVRRLRDFFRDGTTRLESVAGDELESTLRRIARQVIGVHPVELDLRLDPRLPALYVDRLQIELVLKNLLANAVEALPGGGRVRVSAARHNDGQLRLVVEDNGPGIAAEAREHVFEPFVSGKPRGMGLGLAISRAIAEAHGGSLEARAGGHGEFHLVLPCSHAS